MTEGKVRGRPSEKEGERTQAGNYKEQ